MGIRSWLSAPKTLDKIVDTLVKGGDALILTDEERIQYNIKAAELHLKLTEKIGNESTPTALSRRYVAFTVLFPFAGLNILSAILAVFDMTIQSALVFKVAENFEMPSLAVVAFYFGSHIAGKLKG